MDNIPVVKIRQGLAGKALDSNLILATESPNMLNVKKYGDYIGQRVGKTSYGSGVGLSMGYYHFLVGDTNRFMKFTTQAVYYRTSSGWENVTGTALAGNIDNFVDACTVYDDNLGTFYVVFTNGVDTPRKFDGTNNTSALTNWTDWVGKSVRYYQGYLVLSHVIYGGTRYGFRFRCSHTDNPNDTTSSNSKTFNMTKDKNISDIQRVEHFGNFLTFYKTDCIYGAWLGSTKNIFEFDVWVHNIGLRAERALATRDGEHFFLGYDGFYYWANRSAYPVDVSTRKVRKRLFEDTDPDNLKRAVAIYDDRYNQIRLYVPDNESTYPSTVYVLDLNDEKWTWWKEGAGNITGIGKYRRDVIVTIDDLEGTIDNLEGSIDSLSGAAVDNFPVILEGNNSGETFYDDSTNYDDNTTAINSFYETGDDVFATEENPFNMERIQGLRIEARGLQASGDRLYVYYSVDEGSTWTTVTSGYNSDGTEWSDYIELSTSWDWYTADFDVVDYRVRYKIGNAIADSTWQLRKLVKRGVEREVY